MSNQHTHNERPWTDRERMDEMYNSGMSLQDIADEFGCGKTTVNRWMERFDIEKRQYSKHKPPSIYTLSNGYESISSKHNGDRSQVLIHRLLAVAIGEIDPEELGNEKTVIHHRNNIPWDNRPENIKSMSLSEHASLHDAEREKTEKGRYASDD